MRCDKPCEDILMPAPIAFTNSGVPRNQTELLSPFGSLGKNYIKLHVTYVHLAL